ncbi:unnamed protein product [Arctia plantaginis]|uniref:Uncharacterized protein n=1 Tax=Arctia plantaginis TaxID=874455 RepID=A0A8S0YZ95_ARCPL|nr:unnamed protein product [Arctia plantaginis]
MFPAPRLYGGVGYSDPLLERDGAMRNDVVDRKAVLGLLSGQLAMENVRTASKCGSFIKFHIHVENEGPSIVCQSKGCGRSGQVRSYARLYTSRRLAKWWKPCVLLVASLGGRGDERPVHVKAFINELPFPRACHFLAVRDCINAWCSALAYAYSCNKKYAGYNLYEEVANVSIYKDNAYDILKCWQPLVIATILKDIEGDPHFYNSLKEILDKYPNSLLLKVATRHIANTIDVHFALELTGLTKCFGHPELVMDTSIATWVEKGTILKPGLENIAEEIRRAFVLEFSRNFYKQKRK